MQKSFLGLKCVDGVIQVKQFDVKLSSLYPKTLIMRFNLPRKFAYT
jgi:hypothetical protein